MSPADGDDPQPTSVQRAYDAVAEDYAAYLPDTRAEAALDLAMIEAFVEAVGTDDDQRILDAGCGTGRITRLLADRGCPVEGIDLSPGMVAMARRDSPGLTFAVASLARLPYADDALAGVLLWYSLIHTPPSDLPPILAEVARALRPGGHVLAGFQSGSGVHDVAPAYRRFGHEIELVRHRFTADQVSAALADAGLEEVARLVRRPQGSETDDQAFVLARVPHAPAR